MVETLPCSLEIAHAIPRRLRLRWREEAPPEAFVSRLQRLPEVERVEFRPANRTLVIFHGEGFDRERLETLAGDWDVRLHEPPPPPPLTLTRPREETGVWPAAPASRKSPPHWAEDLEALILVGLLLTWIRDALLRGTLGVSRILFFALTVLSLYEYAKRRLGRESEAAPADAEMILT